MAKSGSHRKSKRRRRPAVSLPRELHRAVRKARELLERKRYTEVRQLLEPLEQTYPDELYLLSTLAQAYHYLNDRRNYLRLVERVHKLEPDDPMNTLALGSAYQMEGRFALALRVFRRFLERWPEHEEANPVREQVQALEEEVLPIIAEAGFIGEEGIALAALHEESQVLMEQGQYTQARATVERLLAERPNFVSALNNLSQILFLSGEAQQAIATARRVLEIEPENLHALSNLTRYLYLTGQAEQAEQCANRLRLVEARTVDACIKKAEAFSYLGDDQAVLDAYHEAEGWIDKSSQAHLLCHLAGVAAARLGQQEQARQYWRQALELYPGFELAEQNLRDLSQPPGQRNGAWPFSLNMWLPKRTVDDLVTQLKVWKKGEDQALKQSCQRFFEQHPEVVALIPILLERGGPDSHEFVLQLASAARTPELLVALRDFALSQQGTDRARLKAVTLCSEEGLVDRGQVRMWMQGEWQEVILMGWEIHGEPEGQRYSPKAEQLMARGMECIRRLDVDEAERLFKQALELEPGNPSILNNLAAAYNLQGRAEESEQLIQQIHQQHPDYFFGRTNMATHYARTGKLVEAEELLRPLLAKKRLHMSELAALCGAEIELALARKNRKVARSWFEMLQQAYPDCPHLELLRARVQKPDWRQMLRRISE